MREGSAFWETRAEAVEAIQRGDQQEEGDDDDGDTD
jgi:hypothetical protein